MHLITRTLLSYLNFRFLSHEIRPNNTGWVSLILCLLVLDIGCRQELGTTELQATSTDRESVRECPTKTPLEIPEDCLLNITKNLGPKELVRWLIAWGKNRPIGFKALADAAMRTLPSWRRQQILGENECPGSHEKVAELAASYLAYLRGIHKGDVPWTPLAQFATEFYSAKPITLGDQWIIGQGADHKWLVLALNAGTIHSQNLPVKTPIRSLVSLSSHRFASMDEEGTIVVWDLTNMGTVTKVREFRHEEAFPGFLESIRLIPVNEHVIISGFKDKFQVWNTAETVGKQAEFPGPGRLSLGGDGPLPPVLLNEEQLLVPSYRDGDQTKRKMKIWNIKRGELVRELDLPTAPRMITRITPHLLIVRDLAGSTYGFDLKTAQKTFIFPDRSGIIATIGPKNPTTLVVHPIEDHLKILNLLTLNTRWNLPRVPNSAEKVFQLPGNYFLTGDLGGTLTVWDPATSKVIRKFKPPMTGPLEFEALIGGEIMVRSLQSNTFSIFSPWLDSTKKS